jgi:fumarylacetoacetase
MAEDSYAHHFSLANIPFGIASSSAHPTPAAVTRLGDDVIFLDALFDAGLFNGIADLSSSTFTQVSLKAPAIPHPS